MTLFDAPGDDARVSSDTGRSAWTADRPYVVLCGLGKSGSKRILKLFDLHPETFCRCEPNELEGNPFATLVSREYGDEPDATALDQGWDPAITRAAAQLGERDYLPVAPKSYHTRLARHTPVYRLMKHTRVRRTLGGLVRSWRQPQWPVPRWYAAGDALSMATAVYKLGPCPAWMTWLAEHRPQALIVHIVRHPAGFINSYRGRFLAGRDLERITLDNRNRLRQIVERRPHWAERLSGIDQMDAVESELWYWRYCTETIHAAGEGRANYRLVKDEQVVADPISIVKNLFQLPGLTVTGNISEYVSEYAERWRRATRPWQQLVDADDQQLIQRVLSDSLMHDWWADDPPVSDYRYNAYGHTRKYSSTD